MHGLFEMLLRLIGEVGMGLTCMDDRPMTLRQWAAWLVLLVIVVVFAAIAVLGMATSPQ